MKVLVTGVLGLVGSATAKLFKEKGWEVVGIDNNMRSALFGTEPQGGDFVPLDIRDGASVSLLFRDHQFDAIVHAAAQPSHDWSKENPIGDFTINVIGTMNLLEATRIYAPKATFVFVSTDKVYGEGMTRKNLIETNTRYDHDKPFDEKTPIKHLLSPFGAGKLAADNYVQEYGLQYGIKTACFRLGCITGRNHQGAELHGFLAYLAKCVREEKPYNIFGFQGKQVRDQIHANDLANVFWHFIQKPRVAAVYNMGGGPERSVSVLEAIQLLVEATGKNLVYTILDEPRKGDRIWDVHDVSKFRKHYPEWNYQYSLNDIIKDLCAS